MWLWRFRVADWLELVDVEACSPTYRAFRAFQAERRAWCEAHGMTVKELKRRLPPRVVVDGAPA